MVNPTVPAVVIAAPASGSGKTTIATGLMGALRGAGVDVAPFKVGPDYIDPGYHTLAAGRPGRNLDPVMVGEERIGPLYQHGCAGADLAVVEGVMGLFDGRIDTENSSLAVGSTAHVATLLGAPVILVVDARGHSQSLAALLHGFAGFDASVRLAGVILNRVGSARHEQVLRQACERTGLPVLGVVPRLAELEVPARHLGLIPAVEHGDLATRAVAAMTDLACRTLDLEAISALASANLVGTKWNPLHEVAGDEPISDDEVVIALAGGRAFTFGYTEHRELLEAAGATIEVFDPLHDSLPDRTAGVVLPGGFPEEHAAQLAANETLRSELREHARAGGPIHAECAGLLYLTSALDGHAMSAVIDVDARFTTTLTLGYRDAVALTDSPSFPAGARVTGHEFHRTTTSSVNASSFDKAWGWRDSGGNAVREGFVGHGEYRGVHASYLHTHPAGYPQGIRRFVDAARAWAARP